MDSLDALKLLDDVADAMSDAAGKKRRYRADQFLTTMHARGWRMVRGEPVAMDRPADDEPETALPLAPTRASAIRDAALVDALQEPQL